MWINFDSPNTIPDIPVEVKKERRWLCQDCSGVDGHFHLAGAQVRCHYCSRYAHSYYQRKGDGWEVAVIGGQVK